MDTAPTPSSETDSPRLLIWADGNQSAFLQQVIASLTASVIAIGGPDAESATLSRQFDARPVDDLRHAILEYAPEVDLIWIASRLHIDEELLPKSLRVPIATNEPIFQRRRSERSTALAIHPVALFTRSPGFCQAHEAMQALGKITSFQYNTSSQPIHGGPAARLFDCCQIIQQVCDPVQQVHAVSRTTNNSIDTIHELGHFIAMTFQANTNMPGVASINSNDATWLRTLTLHSETAKLTLTDSSFQFEDASGNIVDQFAAADSHGPAELTAASLRSILTGHPLISSESMRSIRALCETVRLSVATGESESPQKMLDVMMHTI